MATTELSPKSLPVPGKRALQCSPSAPSPDYGTPRKAARCLESELVLAAEEAPSDGESDRLVIDESRTSEGLQDAVGTLTSEEQGDAGGSPTSEEQEDADESPTSEEQHDADGGWTTVTRSRRSPRPRFRLVHHAHAQSSFQAITALESEHPDLKMEVRPNLTGEYTLTPKDDASAALLRRLAAEGNSVALLDPCERKHKVVLERYPLNLPLVAVEAHRHVVSARRLQVGKDNIPTRQVLVVHEGPPPARLDLGCWGRYTLRPYQGEPVRCYKCQRFGHLQATCKLPVRCGVCSQAHPTEECIARHKSSEATTTKCPNCGKKHHAWNPRCSERRRRMPRPVWHRQQQRHEHPQQEPRAQGQQQGGRRFIPAPPPARPAWGSGSPPRASTPGQPRSGQTNSRVAAATTTTTTTADAAATTTTTTTTAAAATTTAASSPIAPPHTPRPHKKKKKKKDRRHSQQENQLRDAPQQSQPTVQAHPQPTAPAEPTASPASPGDELPEGTLAMVSAILTRVVQVVQRLIDRQDEATSSESDLDALLRAEVLTAIARGTRQAPPPLAPQREAGDLSLHPADQHHHDGGRT